MLERYRGRLAALVSEPDRGIYDAMNKGIARATGEVIGILNADDRYADPFVLRDVARAFEDPNVEACYGDLVYVDERGKVVRYWRSGPHKRWKWFLGWMPPHPTFFVRRSVYQRYGTFDLRFPIAADYELMLRLLFKHRVRTAYIPRALVLMAPGGNSNRSLGNILRANLEVLHAWRTNGLRFGYLVPLLKPARKVPQFFSRPDELKSKGD